MDVFEEKGPDIKSIVEESKVLPSVSDELDHSRLAINVPTVSHLKSNFQKLRDCSP